MRYMHSHDLGTAANIFADPSTERLFRLVITVDRLRRWADENSDGWAYWVKPRRAADTAMGLIETTVQAWYRGGFIADVTEAELRAAVRPIKAFLTRQKVDEADREHILGALTSEVFE